MEFLYLLSPYIIILIGLAIIAFGIFKMAQLISNTITKNAEIKAFGSSQEYKEFLEWRQIHSRQ